MAPTDCALALLTALPLLLIIIIGIFLKVTLRLSSRHKLWPSILGIEISKRTKSGFMAHILAIEPKGSKTA